ncbi:DUF1152 domain-containing protein [Leptolyngbya sp. FACHB-711]|uniref:DUF1152 domain-containing protein n=1 Tax=Leptolyngbya sp. FACHB-711 TaxID=2692813 RepID=UPI001689F691|nr:DUF1152 domain-containing protein [Leptolyngbya sp. FACHB-711]MBD1849870.1 DUF1152 domain-containing protein [Cyanobacteria bacterium FACHB-502]MBD2025977.1 DUF1152 domain-containing protein [Leptolyngbya sp. FACHB-711]
MQLSNLPFFSELEQSKTILLAGAGGGFDIFCGLPLYFSLRALGKTAYLANVSFSYLPESEVRLSPSLLKVTADTHRPRDYFPEQHLANWFRQQGQETPIYCFERTGFKPLLASYQALVETLSIDTIVLVDGGTDSLMRGDEIGLGTPHEDITSIAAVDELAVKTKLLICLGFGVDRYHGVCHAHVLEGVAELIASGGFLGTFSLLQEMPEVQQYRQASEYVFQAMPEHVSIVTSSILSALAGHYGDYHATARTQGSKLWINPLMSLYWCFRLPQVASRILYLDAIKQTDSYTDVLFLIEGIQSGRRTVRRWEDIPV